MNLLDQIKQGQESGQVAVPEAGNGFEREVTPEGIAYARLYGYVETGMQKDSYNGKPKPDVLGATLFFQIMGPKKMLQDYEDGEGNQKTFYPLISVNVTVKGGDKSDYNKLRKAMLAGRSEDLPIALMLGEAFKIRISHGKSKDGKRVYLNIKKDGIWNIGAPVRENENGEEVPVKVPEATEPMRAFIWSMATKEMWDSVFIDGEYTVKTKDEDGNEIEETRSKNWIQEKMLAAEDFEGSALQTMLNSSGDLPVSDIMQSVADEMEEEEKASEVIDDMDEPEEAQEEASEAAAALAEMGLLDE